MSLRHLQTVLIVIDAIDIYSNSIVRVRAAVSLTGGAASLLGSDRHDRVLQI